VWTSLLRVSWLTKVGRQIEQLHPVKYERLP
jgi:hypothetical protein